MTEIKGLSCRLWWMRKWRNLFTSTYVGYCSVIRTVAGGASLKFGVQGASATNWFSRVNGARDNGIRLYKEGRRVAQIDTRCSHFLLGDQWPTTVHPFCDHCDVCAFILPPFSDLWATDLLGDLCATVLNMLKTSRRPWRPWRCLNVLCATLERPWQPFGLPSAFNGDLASFVVAQGRHKGRSPCVKGVLVTDGERYVYPRVGEWVTQRVIRSPFGRVSREWAGVQVHALFPLGTVC